MNDPPPTRFTRGKGYTLGTRWPAAAGDHSMNLMARMPAHMRRHAAI